MVTKEQVIEALKEVYDPEMPVSVVDLGFIYEVVVEDSKVTVRMTLSSPGCPMVSLITHMVREKIASLKGVENVEIELVFEPRWTPEMMSDSAKKKLGLNNQV
jgi:FeS assembly SUF system protein